MTITMGEVALRAICDAALAAVDGDQAEAVVIARNAALTRFANAAIHQNVVSREAQLRVRVEGQPSERLTLIERGVAKAVVYDSQTAHRTGQKNTGHALPPNPFQPSAPMHLRLEAGDQTREELIRSCKKGVLITRFWYTRWVHQLRTIVTGMTRDGTFAIEDGQIAYPVKNFRFTQSYHDALGGTLGVGSELALLVPGEQFGLQVSSYRVPALRLAAFTFTGATQY